MPRCPAKTLFMALLVVALSAGRAFAFDREREGDRYRQWLHQLNLDIAALSEQVPPSRPVTRQDIERFCAKSLVPGSRATQNFAEFLTAVRPYGKKKNGEPQSYGGTLKILMHLLDASVPAGQGGKFPEAPGSGFADRSLTVWYVHIQGGSILQSYFDDKNVFKPYRLPKDGVFERDVYPFLLFEDAPAGLRFGGFGREWWGAASYLSNVSLY